MSPRTFLSTAILAFALTALLVTGCTSSAGDTAKPDARQEPLAGQPAAEPTLAQLPGYPEDAVPLFEVKKLDTVYYSVRNDPQWAAVEGGLRNLYHSVWEASVPAADVLEHYRSLCDTVDAEMTMGEQLYGTIGPYRIFLNTGFHNDKEMAYLSVDLPKAEVSETNKFFGDYPAELVELPASFKVFEEMYYETLVSSTNIRYERHFDIADLDGDGAADLRDDARFSYFEERYGSKEAFKVDREYLTASWQDGEYSVVVAFMESSDRGVVTIGKNR